MSPDLTPTPPITVVPAPAVPDAAPDAAAAPLVQVNSLVLDDLRRIAADLKSAGHDVAQVFRDVVSGL